MSTPQSEEKKTDKRWIFIAVIIIFLLINVVQLFIINSSKKEIVEKTIIIENKEAENKLYRYKLDSIGRELEKRYEEIAKLGGDTASMSQQIKLLKQERRSLAAAKNNAEQKYNEIKNQFDDIIASKDKEIETLRDERDDLFKQNNSLKQQTVQLSDSISDQKNIVKELQKQIDVAAALKAANVKVSYIDKKDKESNAVEYKAKKLVKLKITFDVLENKVAKIENKIFYLRLIEPDGAALYDLAMGGGTIKVDGNDVYFTASQEILYDQTNKSLNFYYTKGQPYKPGRHLIEIYNDNSIIGRGAFTLL
ncbi:MAG: hypothetical protein NW207_08700 [Cytophagales bacterium]|nr:hypothetical protein [Cytophagales bacterium]